METKIFRMTRLTFLKEIVKLHGLPWLTGLVIVSASAIVMSVFHDVRWAVVTLMIVCILFPMLMAMFYLYYGLQHATVINVIPHSFAFHEDAIVATLYTQQHDESGGDPEYSVLTTLSFPYSGFGIMKTGMSSVLLPLKDKSKGFIWLPLEAFGSDEAFLKATGMIISYLRYIKS